MSCPKCAAVIIDNQPCIACGFEPEGWVTAVAERTPEKKNRNLATPIAITVLLLCLAGTAGFIATRPLDAAAGTGERGSIALPDLSFGDDETGGDDSDTGSLAYPVVTREWDTGPLELEPEFCTSPGAVSDAPAPATDGSPNVMVSFIETADRGWLRTSGGSNVFDEAWYAENGYEVTEVVPTHVVCNQIDGSEPLDCVAEDGSAFRMEHLERTVSVIELQSGETVASGLVWTQDCERTILEYDWNGAKLIAADLALPGEYTSVHFTKDIGNVPSVDGSFCDNPRAIPQVGADATTPRIYDANWDHNLAAPRLVATGDVRLVTHHHCVTYEADGQVETCEYDGGHLLELETGWYTAKVVDLSSGAVIAEQRFASGSFCPPSTVFVTGQNNRRAASEPGEVDDFIEATIESLS